MLIDRIALFHLEDFKAAKQAFSDALKFDGEYQGILCLWY